MPDMALSEAAKWSGKTRPTIFKAIKAGRISAKKNSDGEWMIDPAELARVYPPAEAVNVSGNSDTKQQAIPHDIGGEVAGLRQVIALLERQLEDVQGQRDRLLGLVETQTRLITHLSEKPSEPARRSLWQRLTGKS